MEPLRMTRNGTASNPAAAFHHSGAGGGGSDLAGEGVPLDAPLQTLEARFPAGRMSPEQYLALDGLADARAEDALTLRADLGVAVRCAGGEGLTARLAALDAGWSAARGVPPRAMDETPGLSPQGDGYWSIFVAVPEGRIADTDTLQLRTALREVIGRWRPVPTLTRSRNLVLANIDPEFVLDVAAELRGYGVAIDRNPADIVPLS
jgi:sulfite reductase beta subunit-like hemoprotein